MLRIALPLLLAICFSFLSITSVLSLGVAHQNVRQTDFSNVAQKIVSADLQQESTISHLAAVEAGLSRDSLSKFGQRSTKFPASWVYNIMMQMDHTKKYRLNFQGSQHGTYRKWIFPFIEQFMSNKDYLAYTDVNDTYKSLGSFDHSHNTSLVRTNVGDEKAFFDQQYFAVLAASNFTVAPGSDHPWSMRMYEAALTKSIPVIQSIPNDYMPRKQVGNWFSSIPYKFVVFNAKIKPNYNYDNKIARHNFDLFIKYQTFLQGDNTPPSFMSEV